MVLVAPQEPLHREQQEGTEGMGPMGEVEEEELEGGRKRPHPMRMSEVTAALG